MLRSNCLESKQIRTILPIYFMLGPPHSFYFVSFHGAISLVSDSSNVVDGPVCLIVTSWQQEAQSPFEGPPFYAACFCSLRVMTSFFWFALFMLNKLYIFGFLIFPIFSRNSTSAPLLLPFWTVSIPDFASSSRCNKTSLSLAEVALRFWNKFDNFWMWSIFLLFTDNPNFWALEQALTQLWQPRTQYSVHLPVFQLPERTHCTASIFVRRASLEPALYGANYVGPQHRSESGRPSAARNSTTRLNSGK